MTFEVLCFSENIGHSWEEEYSDFRGEATENEMKINKNTSKRYSREL